jgi:uncharacterized membrane protein
MTTSGEPNGHHLGADTEIDQPADLVWSLIADYSNDPSWRHGVTRMEPTPAGLVGKGTTTDEVMRFAGSTYQNLGEVIGIGPDLRFAWRTVKGVDADGSRSVTPLGPGRCRVRLELNVRTRGLQRVIAPILVWLLRRNLHADLLRLRAVADQVAIKQRSGA